MEDWVHRAARERPETVAVQADDGWATYAQLDSSVGRTARRLAGMGVDTGDVVGLRITPSLAFVTVLHALPRLGAAALPLDPRRELSGESLVLEAMPDGEEADIEPSTELDPSAAHSVVLTSGTSGEPRPIPLTLANHDASAAGSQAVLGFGADDKWLSVLPLFHVGGLCIPIRCARAGATAVIHERFEVDRTRAALGSDITVVSLVPTMLARLRDAGFAGSGQLRSLLLGGGPVDEATIAWGSEHGVPIRCTYGMTETCSQVAIADPGSRAGRPVPGADIAIEADGEITVAGPMVSAAATGPQGRVRTGDVGELDDRGELAVTGRIKEMIVTGAENVAPAAVEAVLLGHPDVADAGVVGLPDPEWGERVVAAVVERAPLGDEELIELCRTGLAAHEVPKAFARLDALPRNPAGKLLRRELVDRLGRV